MLWFILRQNKATVKPCVDDILWYCASSS